MVDLTHLTCVGLFTVRFNPILKSDVLTIINVSVMMMWLKCASLGNKVFVFCQFC